MGRAQELASLRALLPQPGDGGRGLALVAGEAGSGKSRLVRELGQEAARDGALVLYGACNEAVQTPYRPLVECLDHLLRTVEPGRSSAPEPGLRRGRAHPAGARHRAARRAAARAVTGEPDSERHRLHGALTDLLVRTGARRPLVLLLEDLHWADGASLLCLAVRHGVADAHVLTVATYRDDEAEVTPELSEALADLQRAEGVVRLRLGGLTPDEVAK